ncbi:ParB/RepB/Spo0J family partition protein [Verminephrobacter aporrectodeae subsp. tuberculatae]|uniref:ParB/RepB/Spo0J family partition protein n=1 Tax=Verminephrobacter aporrectodeae TaxID=1110389 RepID=UPI0002377B1D|nr:ParB/RepB/Spo0J family partition protein [Verminephrobacter aporrectodeae]MCW8167080.1 ParB/RepB/Spo0J family partition protein [Verminephrobacter aporrectodeae subsp. tuberculatae]MCW8171243.1 ParB/RepB/Spo0J family partition protein [Verminephrobacter aporrectodeae subsp. tuberculatae]MCW8208110.1 ParB/RepB/Spo0J family partition protein [Verminephrobacter aporrectodeae subsp. tuberculatae]
MTAKKTAAKSKTQDQKETETVKTADDAFARAADVLGAGIDALFADTGAQYSLIPIDMIEVNAQIREIFEDEENTLDDLAASIKARGVLQPILLRPSSNGYELVAGERRYRASKLAGLDQIPAYIREMTDEEAEDAQMAENIHRKNLTQIEEAKKIQRDLARFGSIDAVLEKHQKSRPWLSKMLAMLHLPEQAKRLVAENVSADVEVINTVKIIEKADPAAAKKLVDDLKATRGKSNAREKAAAVKGRVKPSKRLKTGKKIEGGAVATLRDRSQEESGQVSVFAGAKSADDDVPAEILTNAYANIFKHGRSPKTVLDAMEAEEKEAVDAWLQSFYDAGVKAKDVGRTVIQGFRNGQFSIDGEGAFALVAFLQGADSEAKFSPLNVFGSVKA